MNLQYELRESVLKASVSGELGHHEAIELMTRLSALIEDLLPGEAVLDLSDLEFMDSSGIAVVVQTARKCQACGARFRVEGVPKQARKVLFTAGIQRLVDIR